VIELLKSDDLVLKMGGRYRLTALMQKRWVELMQGSRPLIDPGNMTPLELIVEEIRQGKLTIESERPSEDAAAAN
jgi:DNA-directed RNA polymerase subunit omega